jgi:hypothetical protein
LYVVLPFIVSNSVLLKDITSCSVSGWTTLIVSVGFCDCLAWVLIPPDCQGTLVAYPPVTGQDHLNGCGSAKAGWVSSAMPTRRHAVSDIYTTDHNRLPSVDCDAFGLTADVSGINVWVIPLHWQDGMTTAPVWWRY